MPRAIRTYVRIVDTMNRGVGRLAMYLIFVMMATLLFSSISRTMFGASHIWVGEMAQFMLTAYYLLGGAYSLQLDSHVRMDLVYSRWSTRKKAAVDAVTVLFLMFYLVYLLIGGISSTEYAIEYGQKNYSSWAPPLAPIKVIMCIGITLMLMQTVATLFRSIAEARGKPLP